MGEPERDPADYDTWQTWQDARERDGKMPIIAKPVPYVVVGILVVMFATWLVTDLVGGTLDDDVRRSGTAEVTGECRAFGTSYRCPAEVSWGEATDVWSTERLSGTVEVDERLSFQPDGAYRSAKDEPRVWATEHTPG